MGHDEAEEEVPERPGGCDGGRPVLQRGGCCPDHRVPDLLPPIQLRILVLLLHPLQLKTTLQTSTLSSRDLFMYGIFYSIMKSHIFTNINKILKLYLVS